MARNTKVISSISRKAKINIISIVFILFIIICILSSINPIISMFSKRNNIAELEAELNEIRSNNIELLALEKSLYEEEYIEMEALKQFGYTRSENKIIYQVNEIDKLERVNEQENSNIVTDNAVYSNNNLWENIRILYYKEINN
ncbi:MAG: septum formation initiator family protein [Actinomycetota bacterium]|nr:septum formation initiator family protein [Actinomycetota bacterium]